VAALATKHLPFPPGFPWFFHEKTPMTVDEELQSFELAVEQLEEAE
jgi:hypothetical protein